VAHACNPVTWRLGSLNGLRAGLLGVVVLCRSARLCRVEVSSLKNLNLPASLLI